MALFFPVADRAHIWCKVMRLKNIQLSRFRPRPVHATAEAVGIKFGELRVGQAVQQSDTACAAPCAHATAESAGTGAHARQLQASRVVQVGPKKLTIQKAGHSPVPAASAGSGCAC